MPELPEVETVRRALLAQVQYAKIQHVSVFWDRIITPPFSSKEFCRKLSGETIHTIERRGKYLIFLLDNWAMVSHLRMTGKYSVTEHYDDPIEKHTHVVFQLQDGRSLRYLDVRKFGRLMLLPIGKYLDFFLDKKMGPEPVWQQFALSDFQQVLATQKRVIKTVLLDQSVVAGLGNIYVDEILFRSHIHPLTPANHLAPSQISVLHEQIIQVIAEAIDSGGSTIRDYSSLGSEGTYQQLHYVYGKQQSPCRVCGTTIEKIVVAQRGTHFCPSCQQVNYV